MKTKSNLNLFFTSKKADNVRIWPTCHSWTLVELQQIWPDATLEAWQYIRRFLTDSSAVAEGLNVEIWWG